MSAAGTEVIVQNDVDRHTHVTLRQSRYVRHVLLTYSYFHSLFIARDPSPYLFLRFPIYGTHS